MLDSQLRLPLDSQMVRSAADDLLVVATSAASAERRKALESRGVEVLIFDGRDGRVRFARRDRSCSAQQQYLSVMIEAGSKVNWAALESGVADKVFLLLRAEDSGRPGIAVRWPAAWAGGGAPTPFACERTDVAPAFRRMSSPWKATS